MKYIQLIETRRTGKPARFSADGRRISRDRYNHITRMASIYGRLECFLTKAWPIENGGTKRKNYTTAVLPEGEN